MAYPGEVTVSEIQILEYQNSKSPGLACQTRPGNEILNFWLIQIFLSNFRKFPYISSNIMILFGF